MLSRGFSLPVLPPGPLPAADNPHGTASFRPPPCSVPCWFYRTTVLVSIQYHFCTI
nr:MAG TPA: hypothetical protein [Caudoviricetes sp.]